MDRLVADSLNDDRTHGHDALTDLREMARILNVSMDNVYRWARGGQIPALRVGRWRFLASDVVGALRHVRADPLTAVGALKGGAQAVVTRHCPPRVRQKLSPTYSCSTSVNQLGTGQRILPIATNHPQSG